MSRKQAQVHDRFGTGWHHIFLVAGPQYGGYMQDGGYMDDEEVYMTPEELEQFLAAGGQVEYL